MSTVEHILIDGGRLIFQGHSIVRRTMDGRVVDLAWWPTWKVLDLLRDCKVGGLDEGGERLVRDQIKARRHPAFATLDAPVNWQDLCWLLSDIDKRKRWQVHIAPGELPHAEVKHDGRERFRITAIQRGSLQGSRMALFDDDQVVNATLVRAIAQLMEKGGQLNRQPSPDAAITVTLYDGSQLEAALLREPTQASALMDAIGVTSRDVRTQCGIQALLVHELHVLPQAEHIVIDF